MLSGTIRKTSSFPPSFRIWFWCMKMYIRTGIKTKVDLFAKGAKSEPLKVIGDSLRKDPKYLFRTRNDSNKLNLMEEKPTVYPGVNNDFLRFSQSLSRIL